MSFVSRLIDLLRGEPDSGLDASLALDATDDRLAAAALLVHVARIDGKIDGGEHRTLLDLMEATYGLSEEAASALLARADHFDREVDDISALVEMLDQGDGAPDRRRLVAMAYRVAAADGVVQEFEEDLVWRLGHLLGLDDDAIEEIRAGEVRTKLEG